MKTIELTKVKCLALSIVQWGVLELLPDHLKDIKVFFKEVTISRVPIKKLESDFGIKNGKRYKGIKIKANFSILTESFKPTTAKENKTRKPLIDGEILFQNIGTNDSNTWKVSGFELCVKDHPDVKKFPKVIYGLAYPYNDRGSGQSLRVKRFKDFFKNLLTVL